MRVLFVSNTYPPYELGGYEQLCRDVAGRLAERGHQVHVITSDYGVDTSAPPAESGIYRQLQLSPDYSLKVAPWLQFFVQRKRVEAHDVTTLTSAIGEIRPDVVFIWNLEYLPHSLALAAEATPGIGVAYWLAGYSPAGPDLWWKYWAQPPNSRGFLAAPKSVLRELMLGILRAEGKPVRPALKHVGVVSGWQLRQGIEQGTMPPTARVIYNGVELEAFRRPVPPALASDEALRLLIAGRVSADKGVHIAVEAIGVLAREPGVPPLKLIVAGSGPETYLQQLRETAGQLGISDRVQFLGRLARDKMPAVMADSHVLLLPTIHQEPFARVVLEALASGLAVIGADTGGTSEIIRHEETGLITKPNDVADLAKQIRRLTTDQGLRCRLAENGQREVFERFDLERMVDDLEILLSEANADRNGQGEAPA